MLVNFSGLEKPFQNKKTQRQIIGSKAQSQRIGEPVKELRITKSQFKLVSLKAFWENIWYRTD